MENKEDIMKERDMGERTKVVKINGIKTTIVVPPRIDKNEIPKEFKSRQNHPKGLVVPL